MRTSETINVLNEVSQFVAERLGLSIDQFMAVLRRPQQIENQELVNQARPFAIVTAQILRKLGGNYSVFAFEVLAKLEYMSLLPTVGLEFQSLIQDKTTDFVGREYVFDSIKTFIENNPNGYFTIIGDPGQGKSAILAKYVQNTGCVAHFNVQLQGINRAEQFLESVCRQLVIRYDLPYDPLPSRATQDGKFLSQILEKVTHQAKGQPVVIAVDALDEVDSASYREGNILYL